MANGENKDQQQSPLQALQALQGQYQNQSFTGSQIAQAYQQVYGRPYPNPALAAISGDRAMPGAWGPVTDPQGNQISVQQLMQQAQGAQAAQALQQQQQQPQQQM